MKGRGFKKQLLSGKPVTLQGVFEVTITTGSIKPKTKNIFVNNPIFTMSKKSKDITVESSIMTSNGLTQHFILTISDASPIKHRHH